MIRRRVVIPATPDQLWQALTRPELVRGWFGGELDWDLTEGSALRFRGDDGGSREGRIDAVRPGRHLRFVWWPIPTNDETADGGPAIGGPRGGEPQGGEPQGGEPEVGESAADATEVSYLLEPLDEGVLLTVQERRVGAPAGVSEPRASATAVSCGPELPAWTAWDTRLAGAWAGVAGVSRVRA